MARDQRDQRALRELLSLPGYWRLASAYALNELGWFVGTIALSVLVYKRTGSVLGSSAFFLCSQAVPALLAPPFVGRFDRMSARRLLPLLYWLEALLYGVLAWLTARFTLAPVLVIVVIDGVIALIARSISAAARTELLKPAGLVREGGAVASISYSAAYLAGPLLGGFVTARDGTQAALVVNAIVFALMGFALVSRAVPARIVHDGPDRRRLRAAIAHIRENRRVVGLLTVQTLVIMCFSIPTPLEVVYTVHTLHAGSAGYGVLMAVWGTAALIGSLLYTRLRHGNSHVLLAVAIVLGAAGFGEMAAAPIFAVALIGAALVGMSNGLAVVIFGVELQEVVPQSWMALVASFSQSLLLLAPGVGILLGGIIASLASVRAALAVAAIASVAFAAFGFAVMLSGATADGDAAGEDASTATSSEAEDDAELHSHTPA